MVPDSVNAMMSLQPSSSATELATRARALATTEALLMLTRAGERKAREGGGAE